MKVNRLKICIYSTRNLISLLNLLRHSKEEGAELQEFSMSSRFYNVTSSVDNDFFVNEF